MAASWTAGLPKLSKAMRGQTLRAWRKVASLARLMATLSAVVCRENPSRSLAIGERWSEKPSGSGPGSNEDDVGILADSERTCHVAEPQRPPSSFAKVLRLGMIASARIDKHQQSVDAVIAQPTPSRYPRRPDVLASRSRAPRDYLRWRTDAENFTCVHYCSLVV